jgi:flagellar biosynthesis anti-sigma factor FlgM
LPAVDSARVAEIKSAIENGDYQIDSDAIAEAMIRLDRSFGE